IIDPGLGFAKAGAQNWEVLRGIEDITALGSRVLLGTSRKGFRRDTLAGVAPDPDEARRDLATAVTSALAARAGVGAGRVRNVAGTREALAIVRAWDGE